MEFTREAIASEMEHAMRNFILAVIVVSVYAFAGYMNRPVEVENFEVDTAAGSFLIRVYDNGSASATLVNPFKTVEQ